MNSVQTDNSNLLAKVNLRIAHLPQKSKINVLDAYHGEGIIWKYISEKVKSDIQITAIERKPITDDLVLQGDNRKILPSLYLEKFDIIDLDAYGVPFDQLEYIFNYDRKKMIHHGIFVTFIQSVYGRLPVAMLKKLGYSKKMVEKVPSIFNRNGIEKFKSYLAMRGVDRIFIKSQREKHYLYFMT